MIAIIDYGMGNIHSVNKALQVCGAKTVVTNNARDIRACVKAVLPGVGAFDDAMQELEKLGLVGPLLDHVRNKKPFLGICLGMQLLFEESEEAKMAKGLGVLEGKVRILQANKDLKVPHMGWNQVRKSETRNPKSEKECPLLKDIPDDSFVYFCHSYYPEPKDWSVTAATCDYGLDFTCAVWKENVYGVQFHPEKSQKIGLKMLENFVKLC